MARIIRGNNGSFAKTETKTAWLFSEFGEDYSRKIFGDEIINSIPKYTKGKHVGKLKGYIAWKKVIKGGWLSDLGGIVSPGKTYGHGLFLAEWGQEDKLMFGQNTFDLR